MSALSPNAAPSMRPGPAARPRMAAEFLRFGAVGTAGFAVDATALMAALALGLGPWLGRVLSYLAAATTTWLLNRAWTFRGAGRRDAPVRQWALFLVTSLGGFACNYGTYAALVAGSPLVARHPVLGVAAGSLAGLVCNFLLVRRFVFGRATRLCPALDG